MLFNKNLYEEIIDKWKKVANYTNRHRMLEKIPLLEDLAKLVEAVFFASLKKEEGETIKTRIIFMNTNRYNTLLKSNKYQSRQNLLCLPFNKSLNLTPNQLRKISLAFDQSKMALVVTKDSNNFVINGFIFYGNRLSFFNGISQCIAIPDNLIISCYKPGVVNISFGSFIIGRVEDGKFIESNPSTNASKLYFEYLLDCVKKHRGFEIFNNHYFSLYRKYLAEIYTQCSLLQRGGIIIWLPKSIINSSEKDISGGFKLNESISGTKVLYDYINKPVHEKAQRSSNYIDWVVQWEEESHQSICDHIEMLVRMTCVDGALIIDEELKPLCFGVHLNSKNWPERILFGPTTKNTNTKEYDASGFGTRHKSAIKFIYSHPGSIGFVISEDGPVMTLINHNDTIYIWPDCTNTSNLD